MFLAYTFWGPEIGLSACLFKYSWVKYPAVPQITYRIIGTARSMIGGLYTEVYRSMTQAEFVTEETSTKLADLTNEDYLNHHGGYSVLNYNGGTQYPLPDYPNPQANYGPPAPYNRRMDVIIDMLKNLKPKNGSRIGRDYKQTGRNMQHYRVAEDSDEFMKLFGRSQSTPTIMKPAPFGKIEIIEAQSVPQATSPETINNQMMETNTKTSQQGNDIRRVHFEPTTLRNNNVEIVKSNEINYQDYVAKKEHFDVSSSSENDVYLHDTLPKYNMPANQYGPAHYEPADPIYELPKQKPAVVYGPPPAKPKPVYGVPTPDHHIESNDIYSFSPGSAHHHEYHIGSHPNEPEPPKWLTFPIENIILEKLGLNPPGAKPKDPSVANCGKLYVVGILWRSFETYLSGL